MARLNKILQDLNRIKTNEDILEERKERRKKEKLKIIPRNFKCPMCYCIILNLRRWSLHGVCLKCYFNRGKIPQKTALPLGKLVQKAQVEAFRIALGLSKSQMAIILGMTRANYLRVKTIKPKFIERLYRFCTDKFKNFP